MKTQISLGITVRMKKPWVLSYPLSAQRRLRSDCADAQADQSLRSVHSHFVGFVMSGSVNPNMPNGIFQPHELNEAISNFRDDWRTFSFLFYLLEKFMTADSLDPDQMPCSAASDLGLPRSAGSDLGLPRSAGSDLGLPCPAGSHLGLPCSVGSDLGLPHSVGSHLGLPCSAGSILGLPHSAGSHRGLPCSAGSDLGLPHSVASDLGLPRSAASDLGLRC